MKSTFAIAALSILMMGGNFLYNLALDPKSSKDLVFEDLPEATEGANDDFVNDLNWMKEHHEDIFGESFDGLKLHAYLIENPNSNGKWAVTVHGYTGRADNFATIDKIFYENGYSIISPDLRGHGSSEGEYIGMGWHDRKDVLMWVDKIIEMDPDSDIVLYGVSMGGATVMMTSGEDLPDNVKCIVEDCGYTSAWDEFEYQLKELFGLPSFPLLNTANNITMLRAGYGFNQASSVEQVKKAEVPMLFIHGDEDTFVPYYMLDEVYEAANCEKEKLVIEGAKHGEAASVDPELYWNTVFGFIDKHFE